MSFGGGWGVLKETIHLRICFCYDTEQMIYVSTEISTEMLDKVDVKLK